MKLEDFLDGYPVLLCESNYGSNMLVSSLADWLEFAALRDVAASWSSIADSWEDAGLPRTGKSKIIDSGQSLADDLSYYDLAREEIDWRKEYLGLYYPFDIDRFGRIVLKSGFNIGSSVYIDLLLVSLIKGFVIKSGDSNLKKVATYFELLVNECLSHGFGNADGVFKSAVVGTSGMNGLFVDALNSAANELGLVANPTAAPRSASAKDEKVDIVFGLIWGDGRKHDQLWAVQATCAAYAEWQGKLDAIHVGKWAGYLDEWIEPRALIAVPYQMTDHAIKGTIDQLGNKSYLDRSRLVRFAGGVLDLRDDDVISKRNEMLALSDSKLGIRLS